MWFHLNMKSTRENGSRKIWRFAGMIVVICWALSFLGPLSWLMFLMLGLALLRTSYRGAWLPMLLIFVANPMVVWFFTGIVDYAKGSPRLWYMGLPSLEFYNIDPKTRCFKQTGGCLVSGNEWVSQGFHNLGLLAMGAVFGAPSRSYNGPYPSKEEAFHEVSGAPKLDMPEFLKGRIAVAGRHVELDPKIVRSFGSTLGIYPLMDEEYLDEDSGIFAQAVVHRDRCLILRIVEPDIFPSTSEIHDEDYIILVDLKNLRPFAYYRIKGGRARRCPQAQYLPELSR